MKFISKVKIKNIKIFIVITLFSTLLGLAFAYSPVDAQSGCCSHHGGVDCSAGADSDGSCICNDGWRDSSCSYNSSCSITSNTSSNNNSNTSNTHSNSNKTTSNNSVNVKTETKEKRKSNFYLWLLIPTGIFLFYKFNSIGTKKTADYTKTNKQITKTYSDDYTQTNSNDCIICPNCGSIMVLRHGRRGWFYGCSNYPYCTGTRKIDFNKKTKLCPKCGSPMYKKYTPEGTIYYCRKTKKCGYKEKATGYTEI